MFVRTFSLNDIQQYPISISPLFYAKTSAIKQKLINSYFTQATELQQIRQISKLSTSMLYLYHVASNS